MEHYLNCLKAILMAGRKSSSQKSNVVNLASVCDQVEKTVNSLKNTVKILEREKKSYERTRNFWEVSGTKLSVLKVT